MTQDEIIEMARQVWISDAEAEMLMNFDEAYLSCTYLKDLEAFAKLVAEAAASKERDGLCKYFQELEDKAPTVRDKMYLSGVQFVIKQRSQT
jgi:hypothetical protein